MPTPGGDGTPTVVRTGRAQLEQIPSGLARYTVTHHALFRAAYVVEGDRARGELSGVAHHLVADDPEGGGGGTDTVWILRYVDDYVRADNGWLLARRALHRLGVEERRVARVTTARPGAGPS